MTLLFGIAIALIFGNPRPALTRAWGHRLLQASVIGLGAGMDLPVVARVGLHGLGYTALTIAAALGLGALLTTWFGVRRDAGTLISAGTAICGGSAIAAVAPAIGASDEDTGVALAAVFALNALALVLFPIIGHAVGLSQDQFGLWSALAIHDTSSVVGAAAHYGDQALAVATAAKLARSLWIVPVALVLARGRMGRPPYFIAGFVAMAALAPLCPAVASAISRAAHALLLVTLFLVGLGVDRRALRVRPLAMAAVLWVALAGLTLLAIV